MCWKGVIDAAGRVVRARKLMKRRVRVGMNRKRLLQALDGERGVAPLQRDEADEVQRIEMIRVTGENRFVQRRSGREITRAMPLHRLLQQLRSVAHTANARGGAPACAISCIVA